MTEEPQKQPTCPSCGCVIHQIDGSLPSTFCPKCKDNPERRDYCRRDKEAYEFGKLARERALQPLSDDELMETLGCTVKYDNNNKVITFLSMLCTYTEQDQINLGFIAESASGKSYIPLELSYYFPEQDIIKLGYCSPTAFFYDWGVLLPDPTDTRDDVEPEKKRKIRVVDL